MCVRKQQYGLTLQFRILFSRLGVFSRICRNSWVNSIKIKHRQCYQREKKTKQKKITVPVTGSEIQDWCPALPSSSSRVTELSTYSHQCFPSVETGISQLDHLQARWMQTQAITVGLYWRQNVVRWRLYVGWGYVWVTSVGVCVRQWVSEWVSGRGLEAVASGRGFHHQWLHMWRKGGKKTKEGADSFKPLRAFSGKDKNQINYTYFHINWLIKCNA